MLLTLHAPALYDVESTITIDLFELVNRPFKPGETSHIDAHTLFELMFLGLISLRPRLCMRTAVYIAVDRMWKVCFTRRYWGRASLPSARMQEAYTGETLVSTSSSVTRNSVKIGECN